MKNLSYLFVLIFLTPVYLPAQQPAWELVRENFWGKIAIDPTNPDIIYVSPGNVEQWGLHKSTDSGQTWTYYGAGYEGIGAEGMVIDPNNPQRLWIYGGSFKGVVRSEDGGMTAVRADTGIFYDHHGYSVWAFAYDSKRDILYAGDTAISGGIYRSFDGGRRWEQVATFGQGLIFTPTFFLVEEDSGWVYSGSGGSESGIWRSKDSGDSWTPLNPEVLGGQPVSFIAQVTNSRTLYATSRSGTIYKSYNLGEDWFLTSDATTDSTDLNGGLLISSLDTNYVYVGAQGTFTTFYGGFYLTMDGGNHWIIYHNGFPQYDLRWYQVRSIAQSVDSKYVLSSMIFLNGDPTSYTLYKLSQMQLTSVEDKKSLLIPVSITLEQNYPNPFNAQTKIEFLVENKGMITLDVFNINGKHVVNLFNGQINAGHHFATWNGKNSEGGEVATGIYLYRLKAGGEVLIRKLVLLR
jgi:hypothetical protein